MRGGGEDQFSARCGAWCQSLLPGPGGRLVQSPLMLSPEPRLMPTGQASVSDGARTVVLHKKAVRPCC